MKKLIAIILVLVAIGVIDAKPWREEAVPAVNTTTSHRYNSGYTYTPSYDYDDYYDYDYDYDDDYFTMKCTWCHGSGVCDDCNGSGRSKLKGVLAANGCTLCDASGVCYKCKGQGYTVHR